MDGGLLKCDSEAAYVRVRQCLDSNRNTGGSWATGELLLLNKPVFWVNKLMCQKRVSRRNCSGSSVSKQQIFQQNKDTFQKIVN